MGGFALIGSLFLGLALLSMVGLLTLFNDAASTADARPQQPVLLVLAPAAAAAPAAAPTVASVELRAMVARPAPVAAPVLTAIAANAAADPQEAASPVPTATPATYRSLFQQVGDAYGIDWRVLAALAFQESTLNPAAVGRDGDMGLMQILPGTWQEFAPPDVAGAPFDARSNTEVAAVYLRYLHDYLAGLGKGELAWVLVAYNWGPDNVRRLLAGGGDWAQVPERQRRYANGILEAAFGIRAME